MKKMILSAAIVAAMALSASVYAQDTKTKKECTKTEQKDSCCKKKKACCKDSTKQKCAEKKECPSKKKKETK